MVSVDGIRTILTLFTLCVHWACKLIHLMVVMVMVVTRFVYYNCVLALSTHRFSFSVLSPILTSGSNNIINDSSNCCANLLLSLFVCVFFSILLFLNIFINVVFFRFSLTERVFFSLAVVLLLLLLLLLSFAWMCAINFTTCCTLTSSRSYNITTKCVLITCLM